MPISAPLAVRPRAAGRREPLAVLQSFSEVLEPSLAESCYPALLELHSELRALGCGGGAGGARGMPGACQGVLAELSGDAGPPPLARRMCFWVRQGA